MKTIGQVADLLNVKTHVVRYWVDNITHIETKKGKGSRRYFNEENIEELKKVKQLIQNLGMSIEGVKSLVKYNKIRIHTSKEEKNEYKNNENIYKNINEKIDNLINKINNF